MPKVVDAARVTTPHHTVWRTCTGCDQLSALPPDTDRCPACTPRPAEPAGWVLANRYAELVGRIEAWAFPITDLDDHTCLTRIRDLINDFTHQNRQQKGVQGPCR